MAEFGQIFSFNPEPTQQPVTSFSLTPGGLATQGTTPTAPQTTTPQTTQPPATQPITSYDEAQRIFDAWHGGGGVTYDQYNQARNLLYQVTPLRDPTTGQTVYAQGDPRLIPQGYTPTGPSYTSPSVAAATGSSYRGTPQNVSSLAGPNVNINPRGGTNEAAAQRYLPGGGGSAPNFSTSPYSSLLSMLSGSGGGGSNNPLSALGGGGGSIGTNTGSDIDYLRQLLQAGGAPFNATPAWQAMIDAQKRQQGENFANLQEAFNVSGNRFSTDFGTASTDFWNQATLDQNALLGQLQMQSYQDALNRYTSGANNMAGLGYGWAGQQSAQQFQDYLTQMQQAYGANMGIYQGGLSTAQMMNQLGSSAAGQLLGGSITGAQGLYGTETNAALQQAMLPYMLAQMGISGAGTLGGLLNSNLTTGAQLGGLQYGTLQDQINRMYQEYMRTQPEYNPLLQYIYSGATGYPTMMYPQYSPSQFPQFMSGMGSLLGGLPAWLQYFFP